jgi:hypothetical protein
MGGAAIEEANAGQKDQAHGDEGRHWRRVRSRMAEVTGAGPPTGERQGAEGRREKAACLYKPIQEA